MKPDRPPSRTPTTLAVGFLLLDGVLLVYAGLSLGRPALVVGGVACVAAAGVTVWRWRRYRRTMAELERARRELRAEVESIQELLRDKRPQR